MDVATVERRGGAQPLRHRPARLTGGPGSAVAPLGGVRDCDPGITVIRVPRKRGGCSSRRRSTRSRTYRRARWSMSARAGARPAFRSRSPSRACASICWTRRVASARFCGGDVASFPNVGVDLGPRRGARAWRRSRCVCGGARPSTGAARVAAEWCLPLVRPGGTLILYAGSVGPGARGRWRRSPQRRPTRSSRTSAARRPPLLVFRKLGPTPDRFPRRPRTRPETSARVAAGSAEAALD